MTRPSRFSWKPAMVDRAVTKPALSVDPVASPLDRFLAKLAPYLADSSVMEIYMSAERGVSAINRARDSVHLNINFERLEIAEFLHELAWECKVRVDPFKPYAGGVIPGLTWRWHAVIAPLSPDGPLIVLRRQQFAEIGLSRFVFDNFEPLDIPKWILSGVSLIIYGATGSGKTTFMVSVLREFFMDTRVGLAESVSEIPLLSGRWFRLVEVSPDTGGRGGVDFPRVVAEMMRLSPELLVMGELRGIEAAMFLDFARTGHGGVMTTLHAGSIEDARSRLCRLSGQPQHGLPSSLGLKMSRNARGEVRLRVDDMNG